ncbi:MAG: hypothetical protein AAFR76_01530 [Planctomycetota bacterium]
MSRLLMMNDGWFTRVGGNMVRFDEVEGVPKRFRFIASTEAPASDGHILMQKGWDFSRYRGQVLWAHNGPGFCGGRGGAPMHPIGHSPGQEIIAEAGYHPDTNRMEMDVDFNVEIDPRTNHPFNPPAYLTAHQYAAGYLQEVSVGFLIDREQAQPRNALDEEDPRYADRGLVSMRQVLYELSPVPIGADAGAVLIDGGRSRGQQLAELARHFLETADGRAILDVAVREQILRIEEERIAQGRGLFGLPKPV